MATPYNNNSVFLPNTLKETFDSLPPINIINNKKLEIHLGMMPEGHLEAENVIYEEKYNYKDKPLTYEDLFN